MANSAQVETRSYRVVGTFQTERIVGIWKKKQYEHAKLATDRIRLPPRRHAVGGGKGNAK
jgi:hypothetical protein